MLRSVYFVVYPGFELLDMAGPAGVFRSATHQLEGADRGYRFQLVSACGGNVDSWNGVTVTTSVAPAFSRSDTVLVPGAVADSLNKAMDDSDLLALIRRFPTAGRFGSVCSGTFLLQAAGLLAGRRVATHWAGCRQLSERAQDTTVVPDALYVQDGSLWTSAGVTTGTDMALEMVAQDHDRSLMARVARQLIVYAHRPGYQSQFSDVLETQTRVPDAYSDLISWLATQRHRRVAVSEMAERMHLSVRSFQRHFSQETGTTPARYFEHMRLDHARELIEAGMPIKRTAEAVGFRSEAAFRTAFVDRFGVTPGVHRTLHAA